MLILLNFYCIFGLVSFSLSLSLSQALLLLTYLLQTADQDYVSQLDPFPHSVPLPAELRQEMGGATTLCNEIERFLSAGVYSSRTEGLRSLAQLLHNSRLELASLIEKGSCSYMYVHENSVYFLPIPNLRVICTCVYMWTRGGVIFSA